MFIHFTYCLNIRTLPTKFHTLWNKYFSESPINEIIPVIGTRNVQNLQKQLAAPEPKSVNTHSENMQEDSSKSWPTQNGNSESSLRREAPSQVLQAAKNEKVKLISHFTGSENSAHW
ncbi:unnamed protein product [Rotaria socialis]